MKTIIELAREAGFVSAQFWPDDFKGLQASVERFATLVEAAHTERLLAGVEMPEPAGFVWRQAGDKGDPLLTEEKAFTLDQLRETVAAAVLREREECADLCERHISYPSSLYFADTIRNRSKA